MLGLCCFCLDFSKKHRKSLGHFSMLKFLDGQAYGQCLAYLGYIALSVTRAMKQLDHHLLIAHAIHFKNKVSLNQRN